MLLRFLIWSFLIYLVARFVWRVLDKLTAGRRRPPPQPNDTPPSSPKPPAEYRDVYDAKFIDVPNSAGDQDVTDKDSK